MLFRVLGPRATQSRSLQDRLIANYCTTLQKPKTEYYHGSHCTIDRFRRTPALLIRRTFPGYSASADQPTPVEKKRSVARGLLAIALIGSVIGAAGYLLTTNTPQIADLRSDAATLLNGLTRLSEKQPEPQIQTQHLSTSEHAASPIKESRLPSPIEPMTSSAEMPVIGSGYSRAERDVILTTSAAGRVTQVMVTEGTDIATGAVLLQLDNRLAREQVRRTGLTLDAKRLDRQLAELALSQQQVDTTRIRKLAGKGVVARQKAIDSDHLLAQRELDLARAEADIALAVADRDAARARLKDYVLKAPFKGRITELNTQPGQLVLSDLDKALLRLFDPDSIIVEVDVDDRNLRMLRAGLSAELVFDAWSDVKIPGHLVRISPLVSKERGTVRVTIALDAVPFDLRPNMAVRATINTTPDQVQPSSNRETSHEKNY